MSFDFFKEGVKTSGSTRDCKDRGRSARHTAVVSSHVAQLHLPLLDAFHPVQFHVYVPPTLTELKSAREIPYKCDTDLNTIPSTKLHARPGETTFVHVPPVKRL